VLGRRKDGYHLIESLVGFADAGDALTLAPGRALSLIVEGDFAGALADENDNLVLRAARGFVDTVPGAVAGQFTLTKNLPVASGVGGGSSDAAAALRLLARANGVDLHDARLVALAQSLGADVPVCLDPVPRLMRGIGHQLGPRLDFEAIPALLVNPGVAVETHAVFATLALMPGDRYEFAGPSKVPEPAGDAVATLGATTRNDLEEPAIRLQPAIAVVLEDLAALPGCRLARMSGSGATCFALFPTREAALMAGQSLRDAGNGWWIRQGDISVAR
jgi:4-diphosphocytidyl-2-C-methyl-D-erythritol kinase